MRPVPHPPKRRTVYVDVHAEYVDGSDKEIIPVIRPERSELPKFARAVKEWANSGIFHHISPSNGVIRGVAEMEYTPNGDTDSLEFRQCDMTDERFNERCVETVAHPAAKTYISHLADEIQAIGPAGACRERGIRKVESNIPHILVDTFASLMQDTESWSDHYRKYANGQRATNPD